MTQQKHFRLTTAQPCVDVKASDDGGLIEIHYTTKSGFQDTLGSGEGLRLLKYMNPKLYKQVTAWLDELKEKNRHD